MTLSQSAGEVHAVFTESMYYAAKVSLIACGQPAKPSDIRALLRVWAEDGMRQNAIATLEQLPSDTSVTKDKAK